MVKYEDVFHLIIHLFIHNYYYFLHVRVLVRQIGKWLCPLLIQCDSSHMTAPVFKGIPFQFSPPLGQEHSFPIHSSRLPGRKYMVWAAISVTGGSTGRGYPLVAEAGGGTIGRPW